ncbi:MAG: M42 family metallopeptidase, partial [Phycisphaerales bacterium]
MNLDLLKRLCETPGVPGREDRVRELIISEVEDLFDEAWVDSLGNLICRRLPRKQATVKGKKTLQVVDAETAEADATRLMLASHMDEIGFYVTHIDDNGFIRLNPAGGFDARNLFSRRVLVCTEKGDYKGVMNPGGRPIHISSPEERTKVPEVKEFFVDLGMTASKVKSLVRVGDMVVLDEPMEIMGDKVVSKALDNRFACWVAIEAVRAIHESKQPHACDLFVAFTVQEEVGLRGARVAAYALDPDMAIAVDATPAYDLPPW